MEKKRGKKLGDKKNKGSGKKEVVMSGDTSRRRQEKKNWVGTGARKRQKLHVSSGTRSGDRTTRQYKIIIGSTNIKIKNKYFICFKNFGRHCMFELCGRWNECCVQ